MKLQFKVNKSIDFLFDLLTDMQKFSSFHPVISKIDTISTGKYLVHETLKFWFLPFSFKYPVVVTSNAKENNVEYNATVMKIVKIQMNFRLFQDEEFTIIEETINFKSMLPVQLIMKRVFRGQHTLLFKNINESNKI